MPAPVEYDNIAETQQTEAPCFEVAKRVARKTAKTFFQNESHGLCRRAPYGDQLVIPESLRERILTLEQHATVSAHSGMIRMYYSMRRRYCSLPNFGQFEQEHMHPRVFVSWHNSTLILHICRQASQRVGS